MIAVAELVKAIGDFVANLLALIGFIGKPRRRRAISDDLDLLMRLDDFAEFERGTNPHIWLSNHIALQIAEFSGLDTRTKKRSADMSSVIIAAVIAAGLVYLTYYLSSADHPWFAVVSGIPAGFFVLVTDHDVFHEGRRSSDGDGQRRRSSDGDGQRRRRLVSVETSHPSGVDAPTASRNIPEHWPSRAAPTRVAECRGSGASSRSNERCGTSSDNQELRPLR
jgi:hypothetical protein